MLDEKGVMTRLVTTEHRVLIESLSTLSECTDYLSSTNSDGWPKTWAHKVRSLCGSSTPPMLPF